MRLADPSLERTRTMRHDTAPFTSRRASAQHPIMNGVRPARHAVRLACLLMVSVAALAGCEQRVVGTRFGHSSSDRSSGDGASGEVSFFGNGGGGGEQSPESGDERWAIALGRFEGPGHPQQAKQAARQLSGAAGFADVWVDDEGDQSMVYHGRYGDRGAQQAQRDLRRWRSLQQRGMVPAEVVMLVPLIDRAEGANPDHNLRNVKRNEEDAEYTLQIGFYDSRFDGEFRKAAEEAAAKLREEGQRAFYYHGPNRSMVTVGVFKSNAVWVGADGLPRFNDQIKRLQKEFPHNFGNGRTLEVTRNGKSHKQPSFPVRIPEPDGSMRMSGGTVR